MNDSLLHASTLIAALGCGLIAGVCFAFSTFVMRGLARLPSAQGIAAMQSINITAISPWFMTAFLGTAAICGLLLISALISPHQPGAFYRLVGSLLYVVGTILVTMAINVPRNNALAAIDPASADVDRHWGGFLSSWTTWNHVRSVAALAAAASFTIALEQ